MNNQLSDVLKIHHHVLNLYPYWSDELIETWQQEIINLLTKLNQPISLENFYQELMRLASFLNDGHTLVYLPQEVKESLYYPPVSLAWVEDELVIISGEQEYEDLFFKPIAWINQQTPEEFLDSIRKYAWPHHANFSLALNSVMSSLLHGNHFKILFQSGEEVNLEFSKQPRIRTSPFPPTGEKLLEEEGISIYRYDQKILIQLQHFMSEKTVTHFYDHVADYLEAEEIIFDLRNNQGGNSGIADEISQAFFETPLIMEKASRQVLDAEKIANASMQVSHPNSSLSEEDKESRDMLLHQYLETQIETCCFENRRGILKNLPVTILQNEMTYSSAENFIINFDQGKRARLIGTTTAGSTGQPAWISLKTGGAFMVTAKQVAYPNGKEHHNIGISPDIKVPLILEDLRVRQDTCLATALGK